jgi:hypothetical protein
MSAAITDWLTNHFNSAFGALCAAIAVGSGILAKGWAHHPTSADRIGSRSSSFSYTPRAIFIFILGALFSGYVTFLIEWEHFTNFDSNVFFPSLANGLQWHGPPIWPKSGRFWPLGHQEFYPLSFVNNSVEFYQLFAGIQLGILLLLVKFLLRSSLAIILATSIAIISTPAILMVFLEAIRPERNMILLLAVIIWASIRYRDSGRISAFILTNLATFAILFYKETAFIFVSGWALMLLIFDRIPYITLTNRNHRMVAVLPFASSIFWLLLYLTAIYPQIQDSYLVQGPLSQTPFKDLVHSLSQIWFLALCLAVLLRLYLLKSVKVDPLWDVWPLVTFGFIGANAFLALNSLHYNSPAAFLSWLYAGHVADLWARRIAYNHKRRIVAFASIPIYFGAAIQIPTSALALIHHKEFVASRARAAEFIHHFYLSSTALSGVKRDFTIHFLKSARPDYFAYEAALFAAYLEAKYKLSNITIGLPVDALGARSQQCPWMPLTCHYGLPVNQGDLILISGALDSTLFEQGYTLLYTSDKVGFWTNTFHIHVLLARVGRQDRK